MEEVKYYCDICGKEVKKDELIPVKISFNTISDRFDYQSRSDKKYTYESEKHEVCEKCGIEKKLFKKVEKENNKKEEPTIGDKLYDIIAEIHWMENGQ